MRAKFVLAAALLLTAMQPVFADDLVRDVKETLYPVHHGLLDNLFGGLFGARACAAPVAVAPVTDAGCMEQPAVIANTACGTALLTRDPLDLDIRRERLQEKINYYASLGALNACASPALSASMQEVNCAELKMRSGGDLTNWEARRLYRAMDRIEKHADRWAGNGPGFGAWIGLAPGVWY